VLSISPRQQFVDAIDFVISDAGQVSVSQACGSTPLSLAVSISV